MADFLTANDLQAMLQVDRSTIYRMAEDGRLPALKVGRQWRFAPAQITAWMGAQGSDGRVASPGTAATTRLSAELPLACIQLIQDTFADLLGVMLLVTDMAGEPITEVSHACGLFQALLPHSLDSCREQWRSLAQAIELKPRYTTSHLGLLCTRGLIRDGDQLIGALVAGGIAPPVWPPSPTQVEEISAQLGIAPDLFTCHMTEVFYLADAQKSQVRAYVQRIADIISHVLSERRRAASLA